ncbi:response regulator [Arenibaculum pallidiluteum]|uniref:response regulator n=1 Tax=Arenibaculum pallidiluteum TaxID=2812559 RepID=UPI001A97B927|nr:response regulator [Arenibaculum pallidiluteum]
MAMRLPSGSAPADQPAEKPSAARILVAEDNEINAAMMATMLRRLGYAVRTAADGAAAVAAVAAGEADLVLMDMRMPVMDGLEATRRIRALPGPEARVPVVALTADALPERVAGYLAAGLDAALAKPIDRDALVATLARLLGRPTPSSPRGAAPA